jgi:hypothetical protein
MVFFLPNFIFVIKHMASPLNNLLDLPLNKEPTSNFDYTLIKPICSSDSASKSPTRQLINTAKFSNPTSDNPEILIFRHLRKVVSRPEVLLFTRRKLHQWNRQISGTCPKKPPRQACGQRGASGCTAPTRDLKKISKTKMLIRSELHEDNITKPIHGKKHSYDW